MIFPKKPQILYAPMLATFGGGSARGFGKNLGGPNIGSALFTTVGSHSWTVPTDVSSICAVCIGGGGGGYRGTGYAGGGGGLAWRNNISVTPGSSITVFVGRGGTENDPHKPDYYDGAAASSQGHASYVIGTNTIGAEGGHNGYDGSPHSGSNCGGDYNASGGGGGKGGGSTGGHANGGGGAGGYSGNGGTDNGNNPSGGSGGAGGKGNSGQLLGGGGGGVGVYGEGSSGTNSSWPYGGTGGSGGANGSTGGAGVSSPTPAFNNNGLYGGGGGGSTSSSYRAMDGAPGAVRILWGEGRAFPTTNVDLASSTSGEITY